MTVTVLHRRPVLTVTIDGRAIPLVTGSGVLSARTSHGFDQSIAEATVEVPDPPDWAVKWSDVKIEMKADPLQPTERPPRFIGSLVEVNFAHYPHSCTLVCRGRLVKAQMTECNTAGGVAMGPATDQAQVAAMLGHAGLSGAAQQIDGTGRTLGALAPDSFKWNEKESALAYIQRLDQVCYATYTDGNVWGYRTYDTMGGTIIRRRLKAIPSGTPVATFTEGIDILSGSHQDTILQIKNRVVATGYGDATATRQQPNALVPNGGYLNESAGSPMVEYGDVETTSGLTCAEVAEGRLAEVNRELFKVTLTTPLDTFIQPGDTIQVKARTRMGIASVDGDDSTGFWVQRVECSVDAQGAFAQQLTCIGAKGSGASVQHEPIVDMAITVLEQEGVVVSDAPTTAYLVKAIALVTASNPISTYAWSSGGDPDTGSGSTYTALFDSLDGQAITLTVTDSTGLSGTITKDVPTTATATYVQRKLYAAATTAIEAWTGTAWNTQTASSTVVGNGPIWAAGTQALYSGDDLVSPPSSSTPFAPSSEAVSDAWIETDAAAGRVLVGSSAGRLALSLDGARSWTVAPTAPSGDPVLRCIVSRLNANQWFVLTASNLFRTDNAGLGWVVLTTAGAGETFRDFCLGFDRGCLVMQGGRVAAFVANSTVTTATFAGTAPVEVLACTPNIRRDAFYCYDASGHTYASDPSGTTWTRATDLPAGVVPQPRGLWRDGAIVDLLFFAGGTGGVWKTVDGFATTNGYRQLRKPGVDGAPSGAVYARVGADGVLQAAPVEVDLPAGFLERSFLPNIAQHDWPEGDDPRTRQTAMDLWNPALPLDSGGAGARNDPVPPNWYLRSYAPADWAPGTATHRWVDYADGGLGNDPSFGVATFFDRAPGGYVVSPWTTTMLPSGWPGTPGTGSNPSSLYRHVFTVPAMTVRRALLEVATIRLLPAEIWFNDNPITVATFDPGGAGVGVTYALVDPTLVAADGTTQNLVAVRITEANSANPRFAYKLTLSSDAATVSLFKDPTTGKLRFGSSGEGAVLVGDGVHPLPPDWWSPIAPGGALVPGGAAWAGALLFSGLYAAPWPNTVDQSGLKLGNSVGSQFSGSYFVHKQAVDLPAGTATAWTLTVRKNNPATVIQDVYVNSLRLATATPASPANDPAATNANHFTVSFPIPTGQIAMGTRTTVALLVPGGAANTSHLAWSCAQV